MNFITDENIFVPIVEKLRKMSHDVFDIKEQNLTSIDDLDIYKIALEQNRVLLTMDKDFSNILKYPPGNHPGIVALKLYRLTVATPTNIFLNAFKSLSEKDITGNTVIIDRFKTRIRRH